MKPPTTPRPSCRLLVTGWIAAFALMALSAGVFAEDPQGTSNDIPTFFDPPQRPTQVSVGAYLIGLSRVSEPSEAFPTYEVEMFFNLSWTDPRLAFDGTRPHVFLGEEAAEKLSEIWSPDIVIQNEVEQRGTESIELTIQPDGTVDHEERFGVTLNAEFDLRKFPFDRQTLDLELQSFVWDRNEVVFTANVEQTGFDPDFETPEWSVTGVESLIGVRSEIRDDREFSTCTFRIRASRHPGHYLLRFMLPLFFVMVLTWAVFWEPLEDRFRVAFIALLTVVATHTVISRSLPRLSYPTIADMLLIVCYLTASALIFTATVVRKMHERGQVERAKKLDRWMRWLLPIIAAAILTVAVTALWG